MSDLTPTNRELDVLKVIWKHGRATVREVWKELSKKDSEMAYTTALSMLQTMEHKGLVGHEPVGRRYAFYAKIEREGTCQKLAARFLDRVFDGAINEYVAGVLRSRRPTNEELDQLEKMLAEARKRRRSKKGAQR